MYHLDQIEVKEISLVPKGANKHRFLLTKGAIMSILELLEDMGIRAAENEEIIGKDAHVSEEAKRAIRGALRLLAAFRNELPANIFEMLANALGIQYGYATPPTQKEALEIDKLDPQVKKAFEEQLAQAKAAQERLEAIEKELKEEKEKQAILQKNLFVKEAYPHLPIQNLDLATLLYKMEQNIDPSLYQQFTKLLDSYNSLINESLLTTKGVTDHQNKTLSTLDKVRGLVKELQKSGVSETEAFNKVFRENPDLYKQYIEESKIK